MRGHQEPTEDANSLPMAHQYVPFPHGFLCLKSREEIPVTLGELGRVVEGP